MIDKKDDSYVCPDSDNEIQPDSSDPSAAALAESQHLLELTYCQVQADIRAAFERLSEALHSREKQLLRQLDALQNQQVALLQSHQVPNGQCSEIPQVQVNLEQEQSLSNSIMAFGSVSAKGGNLAAIDSYSQPYRVEDYQDASQDHVSLFKPVANDSSPQAVIRFSFVPRLKSPAQQEDELDMQVTPPRLNSSSEQSPQVQQWLQQIMVETEVEPSVAELEKQFCAIATSQ
ncbi:uncharacterized protein [Anabrus simplex]|uniref:uncharacterized protein isoform X1 n=1 Tax=Anabrus simplex TaxID=316456 RepID=UPI0034DD8ACE